MMTNISQSNIRAVLAVMIISGSYVFIILLLFIAIPPANKDVIQILGTSIISTSVGGVIGFNYAASKMESDKAKSIQENLQNPPPSQTIVETKTTEVK